VPSGTPLAVAWIQVRADDSKLGADVQQAARRSASTASETVKGGFREGLRAGLAEGKAQAEAAGVDTAKGFRGKLVQGLQGIASDTGKVGAQAGEGVATGASARLRESRPKFAAAGKDLGEAAGTGVSQAAQRKVKEGSSRVSDTLKEGMKASLAGLATGFIGLGAIEVFKGFIDGARESAKVGALTAQVIKTTGGAAHITADQVGDLATAISNKTGVDDEAIQSGANLLLTFTGIRNEVGKGNDIFNQATSIITDMSVALGQDLKASSIQVGKALNDPVKGVTALQKVGVSFTASQKEQIKTLVATGHTMEAQKVILAELGREFGGAAAAASTPLQKLQVRVGNLGESIGGLLLPVIDKTATVVGDDLVPAVEGVVNFMGKIPGPVYLAVAAFAAARVATGLLGNALEKLAVRGGAVAALRSGLGGLVSALGGPWGIALGAAAIGIGVFMQHQQEAAQRVQELTDTLDKQTGAVTASTTEWAKNALEQDGTLKAAQELGLNLADVTQAVLGNADAQARVNAAIRGYVPIATGVGVVMTSQAGAADKVRAAINGYNGELKDARATQARMAAAGGATTSALNAQTRASNVLTDSTKVQVTAQIGHQKAMTATVAYSKSTATAYTLAKQALQNWIDVINAQGSAFLAERQANRAYKDAVDAATQAVKDNGRTLDDNSRKGRANQNVLDQVTSAADSLLGAMIKNNRSGPSIRSEWEQQRKKLYDVYMQFDHNKNKALDYVDHALGKVPPSVTTTVKTPGLTVAQQAFRNLTNAIKGVPNKSVSIRVNGDGSVTRILTSAGHTTSTKYYAGGGQVTGPGGPRDDKIPAMLSNGEFVVNAAAASRHLQLLKAINSNGLRGYASGGPVRSNVTAHVNMDHVPVGSALLGMFNAGFGAIMATYAKGIQQQAGVLGGAQVGNVGSGVARWAPVILRALALIGQSSGWLGTVENRMNRESGGNPNAINLWDVNAQHGDPSKGLMQVIGGTFRAYHVPGTSWNIYDPLANTAAGLNYAVHRYGSLAALSRPGGYDDGGIARGVGLMAKATVQPERVLSPRQTEAFEDWMSRGVGSGDVVKLHPDTVAALGAVVAGAMSRQPVVLDGRTVAGYVDRRLGMSGLSMRG
jgi:adenosyl cobinamide kinase/adenosyl cobinamide phosphate guanylyltransferase